MKELTNGFLCFVCSGSCECGPVWTIDKASRGLKNDRTVWQWAEIVSTINMTFFKSYLVGTVILYLIK